ncbi:tetratricopeptide repeat protein [Paucisalibacillus sp. EB02]|uniref:tetratricopeptide repeat protein n=1 Tax=Paucisalibacillus sp. EB02 TaxID=1347087 RepID=UPI0004B80CD1|nr:tetratricopeptide repeat protein [Paucisalibacillus sp. EB02]
MHTEDENIILFPKWKAALKDESLQDLQAKRYDEALEKINELIQYHVKDHEILIGKMMCLMELGRFQEAEDMCEEIIRDKQDEHYFHYVHIYLTILFQTNKYDLLMDRIEDELSSDNLPSVLREQFLQLYDVSEKMESDLVEKKTPIYIVELLEAVQQSDHRKQWRSLMRLKTMNIKPDNVVIQLLEHDDVHPVLKTAIFNWLKELSHSKVVKVRKLGQELLIKPIDISEIKELEMYKEIMSHLQNIEQKNPIMHTFLADALYRYFYVRYPILPPSEDTEFIADALKNMYLFLLNNDSPDLDDDLVTYYIDELRKGEKLYLSIIED